MANPILEHFPVKTTDQKASESTEGLCPALSETVRLALTSPDGIDAVVSERGIRQGIIDAMSDYLKAYSLGTGTSIINEFNFDTPNPILKLKSVSTLTPSRISISNTGSDQINIVHDGTQSSVTPITEVFVQGGAHQISGNINIIGAGTSTDTIELKANHPTEKLEWHSDIAIAKIAYRNNSSELLGNTINIGLASDLDKYGSFTPDIDTFGMWAPIDYSLSAFFDQYEYITSVTDIVFSTTDTDAGDFDIRVFFDKISYGKIDDQFFTVDAEVNDRATSINTTITGDGLVDVRWYDGNYTDVVGVSSTAYYASVSGSSIEHYADKNTRATFLVDDEDVVQLFVNSLDNSSNSGSLNIKMTKENF